MCRGQLDHWKDRVWPITDLRSCQSLELVGFASDKQSSAGGAKKVIRADLHMQEQSSLCSEHFAVRRRQALVIQDQSKVSPKLCLRLETAPRTWTKLQQCKAMGGWKGRTRAAPPPLAQHPISTHMAMLGPTTPTRHPAHKASPSLSLQKHSTFQLPRSTLGLMMDRTHSRNMPVIARVSHPSPQDNQYLSRLAGKASHPKPRVHMDH